MALHFLGIRHHGPGSARNVRNYLEKAKPDLILLEGPPEAESILDWAAHADMKPPVAILVYAPDNLQQALFYPFAEFSPEWQAIQYAITHKVPLRFMDLPVTHKLAMTQPEEDPVSVIPSEGEESPKTLNTPETGHSPALEATQAVPADPFFYLAHIAGFDDAEKWWEHNFEHRTNAEQIFDAVNEAVAALREQLPEDERKVERCREAWMRRMIQQAEKEGFANVAIIAGAWHIPAIQNGPSPKEDNELLKNLPKVKVECTWVPWSYGRLSFDSGYGAGIHSPGWYEHIWKTKKDVGIRWLAKVAKLFRKHQVEISAAHIIEAVRLAETVSYLRGYPKPGLDELNEATRSVMCMGEDILLTLIHKELIVSPKIGAVPSDSPKPPLQVDIDRNIKQLRLPFSEEYQELVLDLRNERDLAKSVFLHRLSLLGIAWGSQRHVAGKGTFKEAWNLRWVPAFAIEIIDKGAWGNSVEEAAINYTIHQANTESSLKAITDLLSDTLLADLPRTTAVLLNRINTLAAASADVLQMMEALPSLVNSLRYGNVRKTDTAVLGGIVDAMIARICISLPAACQAVDEDAAQTLLDLFAQLNDAIVLLQQEEQLATWRATLLAISDNKNASPLVAGYATRLIYDCKALTPEALQTAFGLALASAVPYGVAAAWLEGFLKGSGTILLLDNSLWDLVNGWVAQLDDAQFVHVLPLLRRTFSQFSQPERRKLGEKAKQGGTGSSQGAAVPTDFDHASGMKAIPIVLQFLTP